MPDTRRAGGIRFRLVPGGGDGGSRGGAGDSVGVGFHRLLRLAGSFLGSLSASSWTSRFADGRSDSLRRVINKLRILLHIRVDKSGMNKIAKGGEPGAELRVHVVAETGDQFGDDALTAKKCFVACLRCLCRAMGFFAVAGEADGRPSQSMRVSISGDAVRTEVLRYS